MGNTIDQVLLNDLEEDSDKKEKHKKTKRKKNKRRRNKSGARTTGRSRSDAAGKTKVGECGKGDKQVFTIIMHRIACCIKAA